MGNNLESAVIGLVIAAVVLFVGLGIAGFYFWKYYKLRKVESSAFKAKQKELEDLLSGLNIQFGEQGKEILDLGKKTSDIRDYNQAMGRLMLEEQKSYLYSVALELDSLIKKNELLVRHNLIAQEVGAYRNSQLLVLKGSLQQYADSLAVTLHREQTERLAS